MSVTVTENQETQLDTPPARKPAKVSLAIGRNKYLGQCVGCRIKLEPGEGEFRDKPLRLLCMACVLTDGVDPGDLDERLAQGKERGLKPFQLEDAGRIGRYRAMLIGSEPGTGKCLGPDELLLINGNTITAQEAWNTYASAATEFDGSGYWSEPASDMLVNSKNADGKIIKRRVSKLYRQQVSEELFKITLNDGSRITCTAAHKLYDGESWIRADSIQAGSTACVAARLEHEHSDLHLETAELFGWMIGEAHEHNGSVKIVQALDESRNRIENLLTKELARRDIHRSKVSQRSYNTQTNPCPYVEVSSVPLKTVCEQELGYRSWGMLSASKRVPTSVMHGTADAARAFLRSYFDGEGSVAIGRGLVEVSSASEFLIRDVAVLLRRFNIWLRTRSKRARATNGKRIWRTYYVGTIGGPSLRAFLDHIGFSVCYKQSALEAEAEKRTNTNTEGLASSHIVREMITRSGLPIRHFTGDETGYVLGKKDYTRSSVHKIFSRIDKIISGAKERECQLNPRTRMYLPAYASLDKEMLQEQRTRLQRLVDQELHYAKVKSVERIPYEGWVYDLEVEQDHNYVTGTGILCHNTAVSIVGAMRTDWPNIIICPSSVKYNWKLEIERWRPEFTGKISISKSKHFFHAHLPYLDHGEVLIGSYGNLPGDPCKGCRNLTTRLNKLKKDGVYHGFLPGRCTHTAKIAMHPKYYPVTLDGKKQPFFPYHVQGRAGDICDGCHQDYPIPDITKEIVLLADEAHAFKTPTALRTKNWREFRDKVREAGGHVYGLTGTPCEGKPQEFWEVLRSIGIDKAAFGSFNCYAKIFFDWYNNPKGARRPPTGELRKDLHNRLKRVQVRRLRNDVLTELPPVVYEKIYVEIDEGTINEVNEEVHRMLAVRRTWQDIKENENNQMLLNPWEHGISPFEKGRRKTLYEERVDFYYKERPWILDEEIQTAVTWALESKHEVPSIDKLSKIRSMLSQAKVAAVLQWIRDREEEGEPVLVFSQHVSVLKKIAEDRGPNWGCFHGGLSASKRQDMVQKFQDGEIANGLAISIGAGGEGITLHRAKVMAFIDLSWNPAKNAQSECRIVRMGAEKHDVVLVVHFVANHAVDHLVTKTLEEKRALMESLDHEDVETF